MNEYNTLVSVCECADQLESFLHKNTGMTSDWPLRIVADNEKDAKKLKDLMTKLNISLSYYRNYINK